jgi:lipoprotein NlpD
MMKALCVSLAFALTGCATLSPAPVADGRSPSQVEASRTPSGKAASAKKTAPVTGTSEIRPIQSSAPVMTRSLDARPLGAAVPPAPTSVSPALPTTTPAVMSSVSGDLKREPKGGKLPYSEENLARLKGPEAAQPIPPTGTVAPVAPAAPMEIEWGWPSAGKLLSGFTEGGAGQETNKGLDLAGKIGDPVQAAADGKVIYVGSMAKYGNLVIVLHANGHSSVYAHNSKILVKEAQMVTRGQKIAELGDSDADQPKLHFELRQQGKPVDPLKFLPAR